MDDGEKICLDQFKAGTRGYELRNSCASLPIIQESGSAFQFGASNMLTRADGVS
jgi:hypothetical protein